METTQNTKPKPTTTDPKDWVVECLDCKTEIQIAVRGAWPRAPRCWVCGEERVMARMRTDDR